MRDPLLVSMWLQVAQPLRLFSSMGSFLLPWWLLVL